MARSATTQNITAASDGIRKLPTSIPEVPQHESLHLESEAEIVTSLNTIQTIKSSEKNVWAFWDKGFSGSPAWSQRNVISWVKKHPSWIIRVLDSVEGSPNHYSNFVDDLHLPQALKEKKLTGQIGIHISDLIRLPLLYLYGGVWVDVGHIMFSTLEDICWKQIEDPNTPFEMAGFSLSFAGQRSMMYNGFIAAKKGNLCIKYWHETFLKLWENGATSTAGMHKNELITHLPRYEPPSLGGSQPLFQYQRYVDYVAQMFCSERVRHIKDSSLDWDGPKYFEEKVLLLDASSELFWAQRLTRMDGQKQFDLLSRPRVNVEHDDDWKESEEFVTSILTNSSLMKVFHGPVPGRTSLGLLWDRPENVNADNVPGSFAAHLRSAEEHIKYPRVLKRVSMPVCKEAMLEGKILEVIGKRIDEIDEDRLG